MGFRQLLWLSHQRFVPVIKSKPSGMWSDACYFKAKWEQVKSCPCFFGNPQPDFEVQSPGRGSMVAFARLLSHGLSTQRKPHLPLTFLSSHRWTWCFSCVSAGCWPDYRRMLLVIRQKVSRQRRHICPLHVCGGVSSCLHNKHGHTQARQKSSNSWWVGTLRRCNFWDN